MIDIDEFDFRKTDSQFTNSVDWCLHRMIADNVVSCEFDSVRTSITVQWKQTNRVTV